MSRFIHLWGTTLLVTLIVKSIRIHEFMNLYFVFSHSRNVGIKDLSRNCDCGSYHLITYNFFTRTELLRRPAIEGKSSDSHHFNESFYNGYSSVRVLFEFLGCSRGVREILLFGDTSGTNQLTAYRDTHHKANGNY
jgi:hypothetical protein